MFCGHAVSLSAEYCNPCTDHSVFLRGQYAGQAVSQQLAAQPVQHLLTQDWSRPCSDDYPFYPTTLSNRPSRLSRLDNPCRFLHTGNIPYSRKRAANGLLQKTPQIPGIQWEPSAEHRHHDGPRVDRLGHPRGHHPVFILADPTRRFSD
ncbi:hypothetical protein JKG47_13180 [Acidithiobacillus sp. MC6.1]|nr:hypothetical protein [Acidithiobacillus sp. MC6.1]